MAPPRLGTRGPTARQLKRLTRLWTLIAATGFVSAACAGSSTAPVESALVVRVVEDTITASLLEDGTWVSVGLTLELQNQSPTDTIFSGYCGTVRLVDESLERQFALYCPTPDFASPGLSIPPGETVTIDWEEFGCPHTDCGFAGNIGRLRVRVGYNIERWVSAEYRAGKYEALSEAFVVTLD